MKASPRPVLALPLLIASWACLATDKGPVAPDAGPREMNPMFFAMDFAEALCAKAFSCCTRVERMESTLFDGSQDGCPGTLMDRGIPFGARQSDAADIARSITAGKIVYRQDKAAACLARVRALTCDQAKTFWSTGCDVVSGTVALGGACATTDECMAGACIRDMAGTRLCTSPLMDGTRCTEDEQCASGNCAFNDPSNPDPTSLLCLAKKREGVLCDDNSQCVTDRCREGVCRAGAGPALCSR